MPSHIGTAPGRRSAAAGIRQAEAGHLVNLVREHLLEAVVHGADRDMCTAFINIDLTAVGNWAERNNIAYASYQELAGHKQVLDTIQGHIEEVNESLSTDPMLSGCQIHRFLVLHKELDADDGELTRTRKVRRNIISDKYGDLVNALYDGSERVSTARPRTSNPPIACSMV